MQYRNRSITFRSSTEQGWRIDDLLRDYRTKKGESQSLTDMLHFHLQAAWEELQARQGKFLADPAELPDVTQVAQGISIVRGPQGAPPKNPIGKQKPNKKLTSPPYPSRNGKQTTGYKKLPLLP